LGRFHDLTNQRFGRWTVLSGSGRDQYGNVLWLCKCDCGNTNIIKGYHLVTGGSRSCGCLRTDMARKVHLIHGMKGTRLYRIWGGMLIRCENKNRADYKYYGGRGISVCKEWHDFKNFSEWALHNGYSHDLTIDRKDVNGNYCPDNCKWSTRKEQNGNMRKCKCNKAVN
jgi:hypothetical protein